MRHLIISDIHGDWRGLESIEKQAKALGYDDIWFLGDAFGYCTVVEALDCLEWLTEHHAVCIKGNWEWWITTPEQDEADLTRKRRLAYIRWYRKILPAEIMERIINLPEKWEFPEANATIYHGCPYVEVATGHIHSSTPYLDRALYNDHVFEDGIVKTDFLFVGHTHRMGMVTYSPRLHSQVHFFRGQLPKEIKNGLGVNCHRTILVGTGGQKPNEIDPNNPVLAGNRIERDEDPAGFVIFDDESKSVVFTERLP